MKMHMKLGKQSVIAWKPNTMQLVKHNYAKLSRDVLREDLEEEPWNSPVILFASITAQKQL